MTQTSSRNTTGSQTGRGTSRPRCNWWQRMSYSTFSQKIRQYNIESARVGYNFVITSNNIRLEVPPLDFSSIVDSRNRDNMQNLISSWRIKKGRDDSLAYDKSTAQLYSLANSQGYMGSEQHTMWALGASARTGCFIPAEFFFENEAFGGTAGNGPNVLPGGGRGEPLSTIAMAHDSDWMIGRIWGMGLLARLSTVEPGTKTQIARMGSVGLFNGAITNHILARDNRFFPPRGNDEIWRDNEITSMLDDTAHLFRKYEFYLNNNPSVTYGWNVKFTRAHARFNILNNQHWLVRLLAAGGAIDLGSHSVEDYGNEYLWDGNEPATRGKGVVRQLNLERVPFYP